MLSLLSPVLSVLGFEVDEIADRIKKNAALVGSIAFFVLVAVAFALVGANAALTLWVGAVWAPLIIAGAAALMALTIYVINRIMAAVAHKKQVQRRRSAETTALVTTATITAVPLLLRSPLMRKVGLPLGGALAAMFVLWKSGSSGQAQADE